MRVKGEREKEGGIDLHGGVYSCLVNEISWKVGRAVFGKKKVRGF